MRGKFPGIFHVTVSTNRYKLKKMSSQPSSVLLHNRYSLYVRQELAHLLFYEVFVRGRVVICQGDVECNLHMLQPCLLHKQLCWSATSHAG